MSDELVKKVEELLVEAKEIAAASSRLFASVGVNSTVSGLTFGAAIGALKAGKTVSRSGWNGKGMFLFLIKGTELQSGLKYGFGEYLNEPEFVSIICMKTADNKMVAGWLASQTDMLAEDWEIHQ